MLALCLKLAPSLLNQMFCCLIPSNTIDSLPIVSVISVQEATNMLFVRVSPCRSCGRTYATLLKGLIVTECVLSTYSSWTVILGTFCII